MTTWIDEYLDPEYQDDTDVALDFLDGHLPLTIPHVNPGHWVYFFEFSNHQWSAHLAYENGDSGIIEETGISQTLARAIYNACEKLDPLFHDAVFP